MGSNGDTRLQIDLVISNLFESILLFITVVQCFSRPLLSAGNFFAAPSCKWHKIRSGK